MGMIMYYALGIVLIGAFLYAAVYVPIRSLIRYKKRLDQYEGSYQSLETEKGYVRTSGYFTGETRYEEEKLARYAVKMGGYTEYQIKYFVDGQYREGWYHFYPLPDPDEVPEGTEFVLDYKKKKPFCFEMREVKL